MWSETLSPQTPLSTPVYPVKPLVLSPGFFFPGSDLHLSPHNFLFNISLHGDTILEGMLFSNLFLDIVTTAVYPYVRC